MDKSNQEIEPEVTAEKAPELRKEKGRSALASVLASGAKVAPSKSDPLAVTVYVPSSPRSTTPKPLPSPRGSPIPPKPIESRSPTPQAILDNKIRQKRVKINVGGEIHEILWENLGKHPDTRLGQLKNARNHEEILEVCEDYSLETNEYFFDRQPKGFAVILNLYRTSKLHLAEEVCVVEFLDELEYWRVDECQLDQCCQLKLQVRRDQINDDVKKDSELVYIVEEEELFGDSKLEKIKNYIWDLFEKSLTVPQRIIGFLSLFFILLSVLTLSLSTVPDLQQLHCKITNETACVYAIAEASQQNLTIEEAAEKYPTELETREHHTLDYLEIVCIIWFTLEYLLRLFACPNKTKFFRGWLNMIDLIAIVPFYASLFLVHFDTAGRVLQVLRVIRILRIFKLARHSTGLQSLGFTLRHSYQNLGVLLLFIAVGVVIFSALAYFAERENSKNFESIPHSFYWALITMTTVGYGDIVPTTIIGKIISMVAGVCGLVVIALPVGIISNNFQLFYEEQKKKEKALKRRKEMEKFKDKTQGKSSYLQVSLGDTLHQGSGDDPKSGATTSQL